MISIETILTIITILVFGLIMYKIKLLYKENQQLRKDKKQIQIAIHNHGVWISEVAKMDATDALISIRKVESYNQQTIPK